jgi:hypothetical protein
MRHLLASALIAASVASVVGVAIAQAGPSGTNSTAQEKRVLQSIDRQLRRLNKSIGSKPSKGLRGQLRPLAEMRDALRTLEPMRRQLEAINANTAFEEAP